MTGALVALTLAAAASAGTVQRYGVVIGANEGHRDDGPLLYAERDAERVAAVLAELGSFRAEDLILLRGEDADRVDEVLLEVGRRIAQARDEDSSAVLFVYYSGHADASALHLGPTTLGLDHMKARLQAIDVDVRVLVVDACRSGQLTRLKGATPAEPFEIHAEDRLRSEGMAIIASSSADEDAQESDRLRGGVFTHHFVGGLLGAADASGDARVTLTESFRYARAQTIKSTSQARFVQHPTYAFELRGEDDLVLTRIGEPGRAGQLVLEDGGTYLLFSARRDGELHAEVTVPDGGAVSLPPGPYLVRLREEDAVREASVDVARASSLALARDQMTPIPYGKTVRRGLAAQRRTALALTAGGGLVGSLLPGLQSGPGGHLGLRLDLEPLTVAARAHYAFQTFSNDSLGAQTHRVGLDLDGGKRFDVGPLSPGLGVRLGGDVLLQRFQTAGEASPRQGLVGRVGPWTGLDVALGQRTGIGIDAGVDVALYRSLDNALETRAVPTVTLEALTYVR